MKRVLGLFGATTAIVPAMALAQPADILPPVSERPNAAALDEAFDDAFETVQPVAPATQPFTLAQAKALLKTIEGVGAHGLKPADYHHDELKAAIAVGPGAELDRVASQSLAWLIEDRRDGKTPMEARKQWFVVDPDPDTNPTAAVMQRALASGDIAGTLAALDPVHPDYARLKAELGKTPASNAKRRKLIAANMDRWRWLGQDLGFQYLLSNVPEYQLRLTVNDRIISTYKTIVGKPGRTATPQLAEIVEGVIFNPTWTVPQSIVKGEGLGEKVLGNPGWARANGYKGERGANGYVSVVQQPGPGNALGLMKLDMPNEHAIFFHDTPNRNLFAQDDRALSHGCLRTERARELAITLAILGNDATTPEDRKAAADDAVAISLSGEYTRVPIAKRMPVYITYFTMASDIDGKLATFKDIYGRDAPVLAALDAPRVSQRSRVSDDEVIEVVDDPRA